MEDLDSLLEEALAAAVDAHKGQRQKDGRPYILHPLTLMLRLDDRAAQIVAVLHDVVEDSHLNLEDLGALGLPPALLEALRLLTHEGDEPYLDYIRRLSSNELARQVKLADLEHNMDVRRLPEFRAQDGLRVRQYHEAWRLLRDGEAPAR